jgi:two-component system OmpR family sensor kinase
MRVRLVEDDPLIEASIQQGLRQDRLTVTTRQDAWHVFSLPDDDRIMQVAQPLVVRSALATQMTTRILLPWLVVLGLAGVNWWVVGRGPQPLMAVTDAVTARTPEALESLPLLAAVLADHALLAAERGTA